MSDLITSLRAAIENRTEKINNVDARLVRQQDHIARIHTSREKFLEHRNRWVKQNERDMQRLNDLGVEDYQPVKAEDEKEPPAVTEG